MRYLLVILTMVSAARADDDACARALGGARLNAAAVRVLREDAGELERECLARDAHHLEKLFDAIERHVPSFDLGPRRAAVRAFREALATQRPTAGEDFVTTLHRLYAPMKTASAFAPLVRGLREVDRLSPPEIRRSLADVVVDRTELPIRRVVARTRHVRGWGPTLVFEDVLREIAEPATLDPASDDPWIEFSYPLMANLLFELVSNANRATTRRGRDTPAVVRLRTTTDGGARIEIEDFGTPAEYTGTRGLGRSYPARFGLGIGRFRAELLATFMGFALAHHAKADGSGSIIGLSVGPEGLARGESNL